MNIFHCHSYEEMSIRAATLVLDEMARKPDLLLAAATGNSPGGLYGALDRKAKADYSFFEHLRILKLDEWGGVPENHPVTCEHYLRKRLLDPLQIGPERYFAFSSEPPDPAMECQRIQKVLESNGPVDLCILGLGLNGHLGFNEPGSFLHPHCHIATLSETSLQHSMIRSLSHPPAYGLTLGMADILRSRRIILLISGQGKEQTVQGFLSGKISTYLPASFLWLHDQVDCFIEVSPPKK